MSFEIELKFPVSERADVRDRLLALGATAVKTSRQADRYFNHPARDFAATDEALRMRQADDETFLTYKGPKIGEGAKTRLEIEVPVGAGPGDREPAAELLRRLGFVEVATVSKHRETLSLAWNGVAIEAALDDVDGLGAFVELEAVADESQAPKVREELDRLAAALGLIGSQRRSYLEMLLERRSR